jgi:hypothetical protein
MPFLLRKAQLTVRLAVYMADCTARSQQINNVGRRRGGNSRWLQWPVRSANSLGELMTLQVELTSIANEAQ